MYKKLNITENHLKILGLFTNGYDKEYYIREVSKLLKISPRTAQLILEDLEKKTILESELKGKIRIYRIKKSEIMKEYFVLTEQYKKICFLQLNDLVKEIIFKSLNFVDGIVFVFGSYVKGISKKDSDIDLFVVGDCDKKEINKISKIYGIDVNVKNYPLDVFKKELRKDILIKEVLDNHVVLKNVEEFIDIIENG